MNVLEEGQKLYDSLLDDENPVNLNLIGDFPLLNDLAEEVEKVRVVLGSSKLYQLWLLYLDLVDILIYNSASERTGTFGMTFICNAFLISSCKFYETMQKSPILVNIQT